MIVKTRDYGFSWRVILIIVMLALLITSCGRWMFTPKYGDGGFISDEPCSAPCFLSIIPGKTNRSQAIDIIENQGMVEYSESDNLISFLTLVYLVVNPDGNISTIEFNPTVEIKVRDVINKYGEPSRVRVLYDVTSTPEHNYFDMSIYYDKIFTYLVLRRQENWPAYEISQNTLIENIIYFDETTYKNTISTDKHITEWKGLGSYQDPLH